jgi:signal transduction histidine kinase
VLFRLPHGHRSAGVVVWAWFALSLVAFGGMTYLHGLADRRMDARRLVSVVTADIDRLQVMPWDADQKLGPAGTLREMQTAEAGLRRDLRRLSADAADDALTRKITALVAQDARILERQRVRVAHKDTPGALVVNTLGDRVHADIRTDLARASANYEVAAARARLLATVGSGILLLGIFLAFAITLSRLLRSRRNQSETEDQLRALDALKDEFVASVSHELRTPLTSIQGYLELVLDEEAGELNEDQRRHLTTVSRNSERLLALVGDLLFVAQSDAGRLELILAEVDLSTLVHESVESAGPPAAAKRIRLELSADERMPLQGDRARLAQLLDNLVSNAIKFTPEGGSVTVSLTRRESSAVLEVRDTGIGVPAAEQDQVFERFFRARGATERAIQGTGLGLSIARMIAESHGGQIRLESIDGVGTTFRVELPLPVTPAPTRNGTNSDLQSEAAVLRAA